MSKILPLIEKRRPPPASMGCAYRAMRSLLFCIIGWIVSLLLVVSSRCAWKFCADEAAAGIIRSCILIMQPLKK